MSDHPEYEAISYCWGKSPDRRWIFCNDSLLEVTENLSAALNRLRLPSESRYLWADAVCINQSDLEEKSHQVGFMKQIYQSAKVVNVWLGYAAEGSEDLRDFVPSLLEAEQKKKAENDERSIWELTAADRKRYCLPHVADIRYLSLLKISCRPWFSRVWIIQEVSFAANAVAYCGDWSMPWDSLVEAVLLVIELGVNTFYGEDDHNNNLFLQWTREKVISGVQQRLLTLLLRHRQAEATDPKDKIYALCGLAYDSDIIGLDYQTSTETVYTHTATSLLVHDQNLDVLSAAHLHDNGDLKDLPSWVPDWSIGNEGIIPLLLEHAHWNEEIPWQVSESAKSSPVFQNDGKILGITGLLADEIIACGPTLEIQESHGFGIIKVLKEWHKESENLAIFYAWEKVASARSGESYITGETTLDAYWQTISAGRWPVIGGFEAGKNAFTLFDDWGTFRRWLNKLYLDQLSLDYRNWPFKVLSFITDFIAGLYPLKKSRGIIFQAMMVTSRGRKMVRTRKGYIGLTSHLVRVGDQIGLFNGSKVPLIVRRKEPYWQLLGESYIHGMMDGECYDEHACELMWFC